MKPKIFIGSSAEGLDVAYAIQESLEYNAEITVWSQGVFSLSKVPLENLLMALDQNQYAIFVFTPDDIAKIRDKEHKIVRDNVLFELGLFMGRLGQDKTFFILPRGIKDFHMASDLTGITPGTYDNQRSDKNIIAAIGPFCNNIRRILEQAVKEQNEFGNLYGFEDEPEVIKKIVRYKEGYWEFNLIEELLRFKMIPINNSYDNIKRGLLYEQKVYHDASSLIDSVHLRTSEIGELISLITRNLEEEQKIAVGEPGVSGDPLLIKKTIENLIGYCYDLLQIESFFQSVKCNDRLQVLVESFKGITAYLIGLINDYVTQLKEKCNDKYLRANNNKLDILLDIDVSNHTNKINEIIDDMNSNLRFYLD